MLYIFILELFWVWFTSHIVPFTFHLINKLCESSYKIALLMKFKIYKMSSIAPLGPTIAALIWYITYRPCSTVFSDCDLLISVTVVSHWPGPSCYASDYPPTAFVDRPVTINATCWWDRDRWSARFDGPYACIIKDSNSLILKVFFKF